MLRPSIIGALKPAAHLNITSTRFLSVTAGRMAGETGATRPGGAASSDAFQKREKAGEDFYVKQKEKEKLLQLKAKLKQQRTHLDELDKHIDELTKESGGEQN